MASVESADAYRNGRTTERSLLNEAWFGRYTANGARTNATRTGR